MVPILLLKIMSDIKTDISGTYVEKRNPREFNTHGILKLGSER